MSCCRCPLLLLLLLLPLLPCSASSPTCAGSYGGRLVPHQTLPHACSVSASCTWCVQHTVGAFRRNRTVRLRGSNSMPYCQLKPAAACTCCLQSGRVLCIHNT